MPTGKTQRFAITSLKIIIASATKTTCRSTKLDRAALVRRGGNKAKAYARPASAILSPPRGPNFGGNARQRSPCGFEPCRAGFSFPAACCYHVCVVLPSRPTRARANLSPARAFFSPPSAAIIVPPRSRYLHSDRAAERPVLGTTSAGFSLPSEHCYHDSTSRGRSHAHAW